MVARAPVGPIEALSEASKACGELKVVPIRVLVSPIASKAVPASALTILGHAIVPVAPVALIVLSVGSLCCVLAVPVKE